MNEVVLFLFVYSMNLVLRTKGEDGCRDLPFLQCMVNKTLTGHVISSFSLKTPALYSCQHRCYMEGKCVSYNLGSVQGYVRSCELNAADHSTRPSFLVRKKGYEYCPILNPCLSDPCPLGRLCTPDFSWNTFSCDDGGWNQWSSWSPCSSLTSVCRRARNRTRSCASPAPQNKGAHCNGPNKESKESEQQCLPNIKGCESPLGMEDRRIADNQITASSYYTNSTRHIYWNARLNKQHDAKGVGGWAAHRPGIGEYIQIDFLQVKVITMVATQGRSSHYNQWVTKYSLSYSNDTNTWVDYEGDCVKVFSGNNDTNTVVTNKLEVPIWARHIRLTVKQYHLWATMRMELYGCSKLRFLV